MRKINIRSKDPTKVAIEISNSLDSSITSINFSMAEDLLKKGGNLFKLDKDMFSDKPLSTDFKWRKKRVVENV